MCAGRGVRLQALAPTVVEFFHDCFFAVRDRMNERSFILGIVYPNGRLASLESASETPGQRLKRIAYEQGSEALLRITGLAGKSEDEPWRTANGCRQ